MTDALIGYSTLALAIFTALLAFAAFCQMRQNNTNEQKRFDLELYRLAQAQAPIVVAEFEILNRNVVGLTMRNVGTGPAVNLRFSGTLVWNGASGGQQEYTANQRSVSAIGPGQSVLAVPREFFGGANELLIRYEDVFGNIYSTEYVNFSRDRSLYVWRKPHLGKSLGMPRPDECSEDPPSWGERGRVFYDSSKGRW